MSAENLFNSLLVVVAEIQSFYARMWEGINAKEALPGPQDPLCLAVTYSWSLYTIYIVIGGAVKCAKGARDEHEASASRTRDCWGDERCQPATIYGLNKYSGLTLHFFSIPPPASSLLVYVIFTRGECRFANVHKHGLEFSRANVVQDYQCAYPFDSRAICEWCRSRFKIQSWKSRSHSEIVSRVPIVSENKI